MKMPYLQSEYLIPYLIETMRFNQYRNALRYINTGKTKKLLEKKKNDALKNRRKYWQGLTVDDFKIMNSWK